MEIEHETPIKGLVESKTILMDCKTPLQDQHIDSKSENSTIDLRKNITPDRLKVPKAFKYPERYRSPTDMMVSPVTKGILARNRRGDGGLLPPSMNQLPKDQDVQVQDVVSFKMDI